MGEPKDMASNVDAGEESDNDGNGDSEGETAQFYDIERDPETKAIVALRVKRDFLDAGQPYIVRRYSTIMVQADPGTPKFVGYVRDIVEEPDDVKLDVCWFYRACDLPAVPRDMIKCQARLEGYPGGADKGQFKEIFFSNHKDRVSWSSLMHIVKVWVLPDDSIESALVPPAAPCAATAPGVSVSPAGGRRALLPGFICRRLYNVNDRRISPLQTVPSQRKQLGGWVVDDVAELIKRSRAERRSFMAEWQARCSERRAGARQQPPAKRRRAREEEAAPED